MSFDVLAIVPKSATGQPGLYPFPDGDDSPIAPEPLDGTVVRLDAQCLAVSELGDTSQRQLIELRNVGADVWITDERIAVGSSGFSRRAAWRLLSLARNTHPAAGRTSLLQAFLRAQRGVLVGHIRYESLSAVGFHAPAAAGPPGRRLRLILHEVSTGRVRSLALDIDLSSTRPNEAAQHIVRRAANFWLGRPDLPKRHRPAFEQLARGDLSVERRGEEFAYYRMPFVLAAAHDTAVLHTTKPVDTSRTETSRAARSP